MARASGGGGGVGDANTMHPLSWVAQTEKILKFFEFWLSDFVHQDLCQTVGSIYALIGQNSSCPLGSSQQQSLQQQQQNEARSAEELNDVTRSLFRKIDLNSQGKVSREQFLHAMKQVDS